MVATSGAASIPVIRLFAPPGREINARSPLTLAPSQQTSEMVTGALID